MKIGSLLVRQRWWLGTLAAGSAALWLTLSATSEASAEAELIQLQRDYAQALINKDRAFLMRYYAPDWRGGNWLGLWTRSAIVESLLDERYVVRSMEIRDIRVTVLGDVAIVQGVDDEVTTVNGQNTSGRWSFTDVFTRQNGRWVAIASQTTKLGPEPPRADEPGHSKDRI